ncbi:MAG: PEP-CTERM sorting domain-containing protein [Planctomycetes bacterium]|nr:PEP-CTERM sorting domain-containing protein [Planctomycetota bacterium]
MNRCTTLVTAAIVFATGLSAAKAAPILADRFDQYADQAAFQAAWPAIGTVAPLSADLSTVQSSSPAKSIEVDGTLTTGQQRNQRTFAEPGAPSLTRKLVWSFNFYDTAPTASPFRQYSNLQDGTGPGATPPGQLLSMGMNNNQSGTDSGGQFYMARILGFAHSAVDPDGGPNEAGGGTASGAYFKLNDFGTGARSAGWHNLKVVVGTDDGLSTDFDFFVDGVLAEKVHNVGTATSLRSYDVIRLGSGVSNANNAAYYDDMRLKWIPVPEPTSLVLVALSLLGVCAAGRRR